MLGNEAISASPNQPSLTRAVAPAAGRFLGEITATVTNDLKQVEGIWRELQANGVESPGLSFDFIRLWVENRRIKPEDQRYLVGYVAGRPVVLLALHRKRVRGIPVFTWFPGAQVGCYTPVANYGRLAGLEPIGRTLLWQSMLSKLEGADVVYLRSIPVEIGGFTGIFDELGVTLAVDNVYRSSYVSWAECDRQQRSKSRRKHDRQQSDRLNAMGEVTFEVLRNGDDTTCAIEIMFKQRSARFKVMGVRDPFAHDHLTSFYHDAVKPDSGVDVRLHVLRLNGDIVAVRYNIVEGDRMFCLISSMSDDPAIQQGSPGKQCLLRVMQTVFDEGIKVFDMGSGFTDEKRHWCNVQTPLRQHYIGLTRRGTLIVAAHQAFQRARFALKANKQLKTTVRSIQQLLDRVTGATKADANAEKSE